MKNALDLSLLELRQYMEELGRKPFRGDQVFSWIYKKRTETFEAMTDLSQKFRIEAPDFLEIERPAVVDFRQSVDGTQKFLFDMGEGLTAETVMIPSKDRKTLCVSSEVGCNLACQFCFTGKYKLKKRLSASEIVGQFLEVQDRLDQAGEGKLTNVVFMGMGEPLDNPENVFRAVDILTHDKGLNLSKKRITVSTSGLVEHIPLITQSGTRLAVSLNGSNDKVRSKVMPINKKHPIKDLLAATDLHTDTTGEEVTFEYVLLKGVTDQIEHAQELVELLKPRKAMVNLIPFNEHPGSDFFRPSDEAIDKFQKHLLKRGLRAYRRQTRGRDIYAACGQLHVVKSS